MFGLRLMSGYKINIQFMSDNDTWFTKQYPAKKLFLILQALHLSAFQF